MLTNSFIHVPKIGLKWERRLWESGILSWEDVPRIDSRFPLKEALVEHIVISNERLREGDSAYFCKRLPSTESWRLFREFRHACAYLDIETTGLGPDQDKITTIAVWNGETVTWYVNGINLERFIADLGKYKLLVTYNGRCFDIPFINRYFRAKLPHAHIDLRYPLARLDYRGGLKNIEKTLGISRGELTDVDGYMAVLLWRAYERGNPRALETLLAYNIEDVVNLEFLMHFVYNTHIEKTPFASNTLPYVEKEHPRPFQPDKGLIDEFFSWIRR